MTTGAALIAVALLLLLNAFFVLAEFALVKLRPTQVEALVQQGNRRARLVAHIQTHLDEYLSVCQVGITLASIALGFVGEPAFASLLEPLLGSWAYAHAAGITFAYLMVSFLHILLGEQVPVSGDPRARRSSTSRAARAPLRALASAGRAERLGAPRDAPARLPHARERAVAHRAGAARDPRALAGRGLALVPPAPPDGERVRSALRPRLGGHAPATASRCCAPTRPGPRPSR
jgi:hypothetical protein